MDRVSPDFYTYLSQAEDFEENGPLDAQLAIVAGSDTVATTMNNICWVLANNPELQKGLHEELDPLWESIQSNIISDTHLAGKPYLHSIINETLRMYPPVPSGLQRLTPPEGAVIAGKYIPGNMIVTTPTYSLQRGMCCVHPTPPLLILTDARAFVQPNEFTPERWSSRPELILRKDCFVPFSYGPYNCSGRPFAYMQVRMLTAMLVRKYEITFASGKEKECRKYIEEQADCFVLHLHPLPLSLQERKY
jgi:cytochrome P450